MTFEFD